MHFSRFLYTHSTMWSPMAVANGLEESNAVTLTEAVWYCVPPLQTSLNTKPKGIDWSGHKTCWQLKCRQLGESILVSIVYNTPYMHLACTLWRATINKLNHACKYCSLHYLYSTCGCVAPSISCDWISTDCAPRVPSKRSFTSSFTTLHIKAIPLWSAS